MYGELFPVSWSKIEAFHTCAFQYASFRIWRAWKPKPFEEKDWGVDVHHALEHNLVDGEPLTERYIQYQPMMDKLARIPGTHYGELKLAVDSELQPVDYNSPNAFVVCIIDRLVLNGADAVSMDYKTGKRKDPPSRQLDLSSIIVAANYPEVERLHSMFIWTQGGAPGRRMYTRDRLPVLWEGFLQDIEDMEWAYKHNAFPYRPSGLCGPGRHSDYPGCPVLDCPFNKRKDAIKGPR